MNNEILARFKLSEYTTISLPCSSLINLVICAQQQQVWQILMAKINEGQVKEVMEGAQRGLWSLPSVRALLQTRT